MAEGVARTTNWYEPQPRRGAALRYGVSAVLVAAAAASGAELLTLAPDGPVATDTPEAVMVDLPALASSQPPSDAPDGPPQEAAPAAPPPPPPQPVAVPPPDVPPPPEAAHADAALEKREEAASAPPPAPAAVAQEEAAPSGAAAPATDAEGEAAAAAPDAHAITAWQRAMVGRLEAAKHRDPHHSHASGTADVAFRIDRAGHLVSRAVEHSSGSAALDAAALALVAAAAPFPAPPPGLDAAALAFTVPIRFNPRR